jgi:hypothetical protein
VSGAIENGALSSNFNGTFRITGIPNNKTITFELRTTPSGEPSGEMWIGRLPGPQFQQNIASITEVSPPGTYSIITQSAHNRIPGDSIRVEATDTSSVPVSAFTRSFALAAANIISNIEVHVTAAASLSLPSPTLGKTGFFTEGVSVCGGTGAVAEDNLIMNVHFGHYQDTYSTKDITIRRNHFRNVIVGVYIAFGNISSSGEVYWKLTGISVTGGVATATTAQKHGLLVDDIARIGGTGTAFDKAWTVTEVSSDHLQFKFATDLNTSASSGGYQVATVSGQGPQRLLISLTRDSDDPSIFHARIASTDDAVNSGGGSIEIRDHGLQPGDGVRITRATAAEFFFGEVTKHVDNANFDFRAFDDVTLGPVPGYYGRIWQFRRVVIENNLIELAPDEVAQPYGVLLNSSERYAFEPFIFRQLTIRKNIVRRTGAPAIQADSSIGIRVESVDRAIIEANIIDLTAADQIALENYATIRCFNNLTPGGALIRGRDLSTARDQTEVADTLGDALLLSLSKS